MNPLAFLSGWKVYLAAAGLAGLALYQLSTGEFEAAATSFLAALAAAGLRHADAKVEDRLIANGTDKPGL